MSKIHLTRCQHLSPFVDILNHLGAPTASLLGKFRLPTSLEEKADHYIPILPAIEFAELARRSQGIEDFGFHASQQLHFEHLSEKTRNLICHSPTLLVGLQQTCKWASLEDSNLSNWLERHDNHVRICSRLAGTKGLQHLEHSQWLQNIFPIYIVRQFAGPDWTPATIAFEARYTPTPACQSLWPSTRFLSGQEASWIDVPVSMLALPNSASANGNRSRLKNDEVEHSSDEIIGALKLMLPSYLDQGPPALAEVAEMAGVSTRSFQRKLSRAGITYSSLVDTVRFENARRLLRDTDSKIIEVAFASGYSDPAHFTRAFRRIAGVTPGQFREQWRPR
ncbi:AraC family transcriptional regulator [Bradyrhizobium daqingense]|uniref:AraC-like DNA-binding protein n=1 Tax=Bradyrhizobium daqingense TaxID=993502 RepID=A0A562KTP7_9BRAD|nr:AraC family transcriptional regulator [Bradyrhizobium daqingense]TWH98655.1 AraC-like DNA-binding protein [Bradyrhizobium daqingense]UFS86145.1 AraC family transcriptional regulator [Bradyrhizobium daqingense]